MRSAQDCGAAATNALAAMVREAPVTCRVTGVDGLGRPFAVCQASGTELNRAVVAAGWARADTHASPDLQPGGTGGARRAARRVVAAMVTQARSRRESPCKIATTGRNKLYRAPPRTQSAAFTSVEVSGRANGLTDIPVNHCYCIAS